MAYDGSIKIDTKINTSGINTGMAKIQSLAKKGAAITTATLATVSTALAAAGGYAVKVGTEFESAFAGVKKTVNATDEELAVLRDDILKMSTEIPQSAAGIASIAEAAGQLGIKTKNIFGFTKTMSALGVATNMTATEAATALARVANITGMSQDKFDRLGSTVVALGNNLATTESEIVDMSLRLAGAGKQVGMTEADILSFAGALSSVGIYAETGGSAFSRLFAEIAVAVDEGKDDLEQFADVAGMSADEFKKAFEQDAAGAIISFVSGLGRINNTGGSAIKTLNEMGIVEIRMRDALLRAAGASDIFEESLKIGNEAWKDNSALTKEAERRYETLESKTQLLKNNVDLLAIAFKDSMDESLRKYADDGVNYVKQLTAAFNEGSLNSAVETAGDIFADIATKAAESAPGMINAAIAFIKSFVQGLKNNRKEIAEAAKNLLKTIIDNFVKLLPVEVQKPVNELIKKIIKSFESGGLKRAINTAVKLITSFGRAIEPIANTVLPLFADVLDTVASNSDWLITVISGVIVAMGTYKTTLIAVEAATNLAAIAQGILNAEMTANPIGLVIAAVSGLIAVMTTLTALTNSETLAEKERKIALEELAETEEKLKETTSQLADSYGKMAEASLEWQNDCENAGSILDGFNDSLIMSAEKQQELADEMGEVQGEITEIARTATEERRSLTQSEIDRLDELFEKQRELAEKELDVQKQYQGVAKDTANDLVANNNLTVAEYDAQAQKIITTAEETRDKTVEAAEQQKINWLAEKRALIGTDEEYTTEWYNKQREQAEKDYNAAVDEANKICGDTLSIITEGYADRTTSYRKYLDDNKKINKELSNEEDRYREKLKQIQTQYNQEEQKLLKDCQDGKIAAWDYEMKLRELNDKKTKEASELKNEHIAKIEEKRNEQNKLNNDEQVKEENKMWASILSKTEMYGGKLGTKSREISSDMLAAYSNLPDDCKQNMKEAMQGMYDGLEEREPSLLAKAAGIADGVISKIRKIFDINSPSRVMRKIFRQVIEGGEIGVDDETPSLISKGKSAAEKFIDKTKSTLSKASISAKLKSTVAAEQRKLNAILTSETKHKVDVAVKDNKKRTVIASGDIVVPIYVDGRELVIAQKPYLLEELAFE